MEFSDNNEADFEGWATEEAVSQKPKSEPKPKTPRTALIPASTLTSRVWSSEDPFPVDLKGQWKVSASQVKTWQACPRKWGFKYLDGIQDPPGKAAQFGTAVHGVLEDYFNTGAMPDTTTREGKVAAAGLSHYPTRKDVDVELEIFFITDGVLYRGFVDAAWGPETDDDLPDIYDHKTSSNPEKYGLTPKSLPHDPQGLIYGVWALDFWDVPGVNLNWVYYKTKGRAVASRVSAHLSREDAQANFQKTIAPIGKAIVDARAGFTEGTIKGGNDLEANPRACGDFGGCPFAPFCRRTQDEVLTAAFGPATSKTQTKNKSKTNMGLQDLLRKKKAKRQAPPRVGTPAMEAATNINPPEQPASAEVAREVSRAVGEVTGNAKTRKEKARDITNAAAGETDPEAAKQKARAALAEAEAPKDGSSEKGKAPTEAEVLAYVSMGVHRFSSTRAKATEDLPFVHGRTLKAMKMKGLINYRDNYPDKGVRTVMLTDKGKEVSGLHASHAEPKPVSGEVEVPAAPEHVEPADTEPDLSVRVPPVRKGNNLPPISGVIEVRPAPSHQEVFTSFLLAMGGDADKANGMFDAYCAHFPMGGAR
jgi:hypothetical protein